MTLSGLDSTNFDTPTTTMAAAAVAVASFLQTASNNISFAYLNGSRSLLDEPQQQQQQQQQPFNQTENGPSEEYIYFLNTVRFWIQRVLVPIIMAIGIVGNSITIVIMTRRRMRSSTNWYLAVLAIFDMIYLIFTFVLSLQHYPNAHHIDYYYYWYMIPFMMMITDASSNTSVWLTVAFTIERYIAVCHPIKGKVICTESRAKKVILCVFIICMSVTIPTPFEWIIFEQYDNSTNQTTMSSTFSDLGNNETYQQIYYNLNVFLFVLLPLVLLVIFNSFLIRSVHISNKQRAKMMGNDNFKQNQHSTQHQHSPPNTVAKSEQAMSASRQEIRITIMLIAVVILFIMCQTPTACILIYTALYKTNPNTNEHNLVVGLGNIFNFLMSINAAGNFLLYCLLSQKYRRTFVNMFCPCIAAKYTLASAASTYPRSKAETVSGSYHQSIHYQQRKLDLQKRPSVTESGLLSSRQANGSPSCPPPLSSSAFSTLNSIAASNRTNDTGGHRKCNRLSGSSECSGTSDP